MEKDQESANALTLLNSGESLGKVSEPTRHREDVMDAAVALNVTNLSYCTNEFKSNPASMLSAVRHDPAAVEYADANLFTDKDWIRGLLDIQPELYKRAKGDVPHDYDVALFACTKHGMNLQYVAEELRNNREIVLAAVQARGTSLTYASAELKNNREIVWAAIKENRMALTHASPSLKADEELHTYVTSQVDDDASEEVSRRGQSRRMKELFQQADKDGDGTIDTIDLERLLKKLDGEQWTHMKASRLLNAMDKNKDGYVSFEEFVDWIHGGCELEPRFDVAVDKWKEGNY
jgi:hypothetical protein